MDAKRAPTSKAPENHRDDASRQAAVLWLVHFVLGAALIVAGALKLHHLAFDLADESLETLSFMALAEAELLGGVWMATGFGVARVHPWSVAAFAGFSVAALLRGATGACSCGCFGRFTLSPWLGLVFDLAAVTALLALWPAATPRAATAASPARLLGMTLLAAGVAVAGWRQVDLVAVGGSAVADGNPLKETLLVFTGESGKITLRTDADGGFRLPLIRPGRYAVSLAERTAPPPREQPAVRGPAKRKALGRARARPEQKEGGDPVSWIEVSSCLDSTHVVEFSLW